jgi:hypothetical protein
MAARLRADHHLLASRETGDPQVETRCHLFGLEALLRAHIDREERFLIPLLDNGASKRASSSPSEPFGTTG